jgi:hypothetical protein
MCGEASFKMYIVEDMRIQCFAVPTEVGITEKFISYSVMLSYQGNG